MVGILYGRSHYNSLSAKEAIIREEEVKKAVIRDAQLAEEKLKLNKGKNLGNMSCLLKIFYRRKVILINWYMC